MKTLRAHKVGTFFTEASKTPHFGVTKGESAILHFHGTRPAGSTPLEKRIAGGRTSS
jgi:hypothetical protein